VRIVTPIESTGMVHFGVDKWMGVHGSISADEKISNARWRSYCKAMVQLSRFLVNSRRESL